MGEWRTAGRKYRETGVPVSLGLSDVGSCVPVHAALPFFIKQQYKNSGGQPCSLLLLRQLPASQA